VCVCVCARLCVVCVCVCVCACLCTCVCLCKCVCLCIHVMLMSMCTSRANTCRAAPWVIAVHERARHIATVQFDDRAIQVVAQVQIPRLAAAQHIVRRQKGPCLFTLHLAQMFETKHDLHRKRARGQGEKNMLHHNKSRHTFEKTHISEIGITGAWEAHKLIW